MNPGPHAKLYDEALCFASVVNGDGGRGASGVEHFRLSCGTLRKMRPPPQGEAPRIGLYGGAALQ